MGLIDFVKSAGAKILGGDDEKPAAAAPTRSVEESLAILNEKRAAALADAVSKMDLEVEDLGITLNDGVARVTGKTPNQETREKIILVVGNTNGVGQVDDQLEVVAAEPEAVYYTVERGDTLSKIAKEHYGNAMKYPVIFEANKPMLSDPDKIYPGQVLRIPPVEG